MCDCIKRVSDRIHELVPEADRVSVDHEMLSGKTYSTAFCYIPGKKKPTEKMVLHTFCPFCGERFDKEARP